jgi:hypothetical protein
LFTTIILRDIPLENSVPAYLPELVMSGTQRKLEVIHKIKGQDCGTSMYENNESLENSSFSSFMG